MSTVDELGERLARARELSGADRASASIFDSSSRTFELLAWDGDWLLAPGTRFPLATSTHFSLAAAGKTFVSSRFARDPRFRRPVDAIVKAHGFRAGSCVPLVGANGVVGAVALHHRAGGRTAEQAPQRIAEEIDGLVAALHARRDTRRIDVLIHHADPLVGRGLLHLLGEDTRLVVRLCDSEAIALASVAELPPAVVVTDAPGLVSAFAGSGTAAAVVLADNPSTVGRREAEQAGAAGYVGRGEAPLVLSAAVRAVADGGTWLPRQTFAPVLTARELDVLRLLDRGHRLSQIATELGVAHATVKAHSRSLHRKLDATSRAEACFAARTRGIL